VTPDKFAEVERLPARVTAATPLGALAPVVSGGALMLEGEGAADTEFPFGANVASQVIFDMDGDRTLGAVETLVPLDSWEQTDADLSPPGQTRPGSVQIVGDAVEVHVPDAEPRFLVNGDQGRC
jgi:hypothetical protein